MSEPVSVTSLAVGSTVAITSGLVLQNVTTNASIITAGTHPIARGGTNITTYAAGDILYASATDVLSKLAKGTDGQVLTLASGVPSWAAASGGASATDGSWTPVLVGSTTSGSHTYSEQTGTYTQVGKSVHVAGSITIASKGTIAGTLSITGLPFSKGGGAFSFGTCQVLNVTLTAGYHLVTARIGNGSSIVLLENGGGSANDLNASALAASNAVIRFSAEYRTA